MVTAFAECYLTIGRSTGRVNFLSTYMVFASSVRWIPQMHVEHRMARHPDDAWFRSRSKDPSREKPESGFSTGSVVEQETYPIERGLSKGPPASTSQGSSAMSTMSEGPLPCPIMVGEGSSEGEYFCCCKSHFSRFRAGLPHLSIHRIRLTSFVQQPCPCITVRFAPFIQSDRQTVLMGLLG